MPATSELPTPSASASAPVTTPTRLHPATYWAESKLAPPAARSQQVLRASLRDLIAASAGKLTLVRAPAGFGKSTIMNQARLMLEDKGIATAWISLDRSDNDASRFCHCLDHAACSLGLWDQQRSTPLDAALPWQQATTPYALFLDDFENVHEHTVLGIVREIIEQLPRRCYLIIGTRTLPQLGIARLRSRDMLEELDGERLRFTLEETQQFLRETSGDGLSPSLVQTLHERTEGWVAALWLASLALSRQADKAAFIERFSGSNRDIADYLAEEVVYRESPEMQDFLLKTSILRQLDASVCAALLPRLDSTALLERLNDSALFLIPLASERQAWRYHSLFSDYLKRELHARMPEEAARLHLAAASWFEEQGRPVPAIDHAFEGGDFPYGLDMLKTHAEEFLQRGRMRLLARWFAGLPGGLLHAHPELQMAAVWAICFTYGPWQAETMLREALQQHAGDAAMEAHADCIWPMLLAMQDRTAEGQAVGKSALQRPPTGQHFADNTLLTAMAHITTIMGQPSEARALLQAAREQSRSTSTFQHMYTETTEGLLDMQEGRLRQAAARFRLAVDSTHSLRYNHTHGNAWAGVFFAYVVYEVNQLEQAEHLLNVYLPMAREVGLPDHMILSHAMRARIAFWRGDIDTALALLTELEFVGHRRKIPRVVAAGNLERARFYTMQRNAQAAKSELLKADLPEVWAREGHERMFAHETESYGLGMARWEVHFGEPALALQRIDVQLALASHTRRQPRIHLLQLLRSMALAKQGDLATALAVLGQQLSALAEEGFMRLLLDEGPELGLLVRRYQALQHDKHHSSPFMQEYLARLLQAFGPLPEEPEAPSAANDVFLLEALTRKEARVLTLLAEGYSNSAMAEKLFVSDSTVRTHLRNINTKLNAGNRTQAVAYARKLGLVP